MSETTYKILIGATGSVATIKIPLLIQSIIDLNLANLGYKFELPSVIVTERAKHFLKESGEYHLNFLDDEAEWSSWQKRGDPVLHIELGKEADLLVIAPLDANTLAKISQGICDNLLTSVVRAWDLSKPLLFCPAMNTRMWEHPITSKQVSILNEWGYIEVPPISKTLMCGDTGIGAMAEVETIVNKIKNISSDNYKTTKAT